MDEQIKHIYMIFLSKKKKKALNYWDCIENVRFDGEDFIELAQDIVDDLIIKALGDKKWQ